MNNKRKDWMEKLVKNYNIPPDNSKEKREPKRILKESQLKKITERDN